MAKIYYIGQCPICCKYGKLEVDKDVTNNKFMVICEECLAEWNSPEDALKNVNGQRRFIRGEVRGATLEEIEELGWEQYVVSIEEE